jgi:hypothetical protein
MVGLNKDVILLVYLFFCKDFLLEFVRSMTCYITCMFLLKIFYWSLLDP